MKKNNKGFTLIELMVVVLIIAVLAIIAIPLFGHSKADAERTACFANQRIIEDAAEMWAASEVNNSAGNIYGEINDNHILFQEPKFLKSVPKCPGTHGFYYIQDNGKVGRCMVHGYYNEDVNR